MSIMILVFVVLGGIGNIRGSMIAAVILTLLPEMLRSLNNYRMLIYAVVLIVMMLLTSSPKAIEVPRAHLFIIPEKEDRRGGVNHGNAGCKNLSISFGGLKAVDDFQHHDKKDSSTA